MKRGVANSSYYADLDGYQTSSSSGGLSYSPVNGQEYGFNYLYSEGVSRFDTLFGALDRNYTQNQTISSFNLYSRHGLSNIWSTTVRVGQSLDDSRYLNNEALDSSFKTIQTHYQIQNDIRLPLGVALLAFESFKQRIDSSENFKLKDRDIDSVMFGWSGSFGLHRLQSSLRQDRNSQFGSYSSGMLGYGYQLSSYWRSSVSYGTAFKTPTFNQLYFSDIWGSIGNPNLKPENSVNREASVRYESDAQNSSVTYYQNDVSNLIQWEIIDPITEAVSPRNVSSAKLTGWTFAHKSNIGKYGIYGSLDLQDPKDELLNRTLANRSKEILKLGLSRNFGALTLASELMSTGKRFEYNDYPTPNLALYELGGYTLVNLRLNYTGSKEWSIFARANNIFDKKYVLVEGYATPGSSLFAGVRYTPK
jgi:vitamin B12 transporter